MNLKGKVKKKSYKYRSLFKNGVSPGDPIDLVLNEMIDLKLETGEEIEKYFELSKRINSLLITANARQPEKQTEKLDKVPDKSDKTVPLEKVKIPLQIEEKMDQEAFMGTDFKSEISIIRIIKDMVEVSVVLSHRIEAYNALNPKSPIENVSQLTFPSLSEVNRIFKSEQKKLGEDVSEAA